MPPFVRLGWHGCQSDRHRQESGHNKRSFHLEQAPSRLYEPTSHRSSEADGDQTERVISERVPASEGGARAPGKSDDDRATMPRLHPLQPSRSKFRIRRMHIIIATARRVSVGLGCPKDRA